MWNPLASLPASNVGALAPYAPAAMPDQTPVQGLHPIYGRGPNTRFPLNPGMMNGVADPSAFQSAMQAWRGDRPDLTRFDPRALMGGQPEGQFDPRQARMDWQTNTFDPWRQNMTDWRGARPLRSDF